MKKIIVSHPTSNQNNRAVLKGLFDANRLSGFYTSIATFPNDFFDKLSNIGPFRQIGRRRFVNELKTLTHAHPFNEMIRLVALKLKMKSLTKHETGKFSVDAIYHNIDKKLATQIKKESKKNLGAIYAYEDGAYFSFLEAKKYGIKCIYDLPIAYWETGKNLMKEEFERLPDWADTIKSGLSDSQEKLIRKENELKLADVIVVPSQFVKDSIPSWAQNKQIIMTPFGSPEPNVSNSIKPEKQNNSKPLRILFVGSMSQRKGLGDLFNAMNIVDSSKVELVVLGSLRAPFDFYKSKIKRGFTHEKGRPHSEVLELMKTCDVFCLPSIVEGRALVMQEAMSQGLPLIITPNTGGEDLIKEGQTGFLVPIRSPEVIAEKINWFLNNRSEIPNMGMMAQKHASKYTWKNYSDNIVNALTDL